MCSVTFSTAIEMMAHAPVTPRGLPARDVGRQGHGVVVLERDDNDDQCTAGVFPRMIDQFLRQRSASVLPPRDLERLGSYLRAVIKEAVLPPRAEGRLDWNEIAVASGVDADALAGAGSVLEPGIDAITRFVGQTARRHKLAPAAVKDSEARPAPGRRSCRRLHAREGGQGSPLPHLGRPTIVRLQPHLHHRSDASGGTQPRPIVEFPEPLWTDWEEPETFPAALKLHIDRHGDSAWHLPRALVKSHEAFDHKTFVTWIQGTTAPRSVSSFEILGPIERRYRLPEGYFKAKLAHPARATTGIGRPDVTPSQHRRIAWHLTVASCRRTRQRWRHAFSPKCGRPSKRLLGTPFCF